MGTIRENLIKDIETRLIEGCNDALGLTPSATTCREWAEGLIGYAIARGRLPTQDDVTNLVYGVTPKDVIDMGGEPMTIPEEV
jgi:hypothetical protein